MERRLEGPYLQAAEALILIAQARADLNEREAAAKLLLASFLEVGDDGLNESGVALVKWRPGALRFKAALAEARLSPEDLARVQVFTVDGALAKRHLAPADYEACCERASSSVVIA